MTKILVVDDEPQILRALRVNLAARHYEAAVAADGATALCQAAEWHPDLIILVALLVLAYAASVTDLAAAVFSCPTLAL
ncbi:hypothetical protein ABZW11_12980 [Nonomuraea sp. NPDC004580]|uniref:hypothetical protein n=1 Tax=Nonomuraea sp. NPDC004580 TaxID=3154552 RepID=UPI0033BD37A7